MLWHFTGHLTHFTSRKWLLLWGRVCIHQPKPRWVVKWCNMWNFESLRPHELQFCGSSLTLTCWSHRSGGFRNLRPQAAWHRSWGLGWSRMPPHASAISVTKATAPSAKHIFQHVSSQKITRLMLITFLDWIEWCKKGLTFLPLAGQPTCAVVLKVVFDENEKKLRGLAGPLDLRFLEMTSWLSYITSLGRFLIHENPPFIVSGGRWLRMIGKPSSFWATTCWR